MPDWLAYVIATMVLAGLLVQVALLLNVHKMLSRVAAIRRDLESRREDGVSSHVVEAVTQLQSVAVSADRIAMRCDALAAKLDEIAARAPAQAGGDAGPAVAAIRDALSDLRAPVAEIRDRLARNEIERVADEVRRQLYLRGYEGVTLLTDIATVPKTGESKVQVEVVREGVKSKGYVLVRDGAAVETKISPTYEMFP